MYTYTRQRADAAASAEEPHRHRALHNVDLPSPAGLDEGLPGPARLDETYCYCYYY